MKRLKGEVERMKKVMKRVITACLAFAMILALVTPASVEAATKNESLTLYKGETYTWYLTGVKSLSSASSSKKAVATVKANKSKKQYTISAKKAGNTGSEVAAKDEIVYRVMSGKTAYERIYVSSAADVDLSQSSVKVTAFDRNPEQKYKVLGTDKLSVTVTDEQVSDSSISFKLKKVNKTSQYVYGEIYIISYDANGTIIDVSTSSLYLDKKEIQTTSESVSKSPYSHPNFDHYEIVYGGYYTTK